jgi:hypothetical protein
LDTTHNPLPHNGLHQSEMLGQIAVVERVEGLQLVLHPAADVLLDAARRIHDPLIALGLATLPPHTAQRLPHIVRTPVGTDDAGARILSIQIVEVDANTTGGNVDHHNALFV